MSFRHLCALGCHYTIPGTRRIFMSKALRTALSLVFRLVLVIMRTSDKTTAKKAVQDMTGQDSVRAKMWLYETRKDADQKASCHSTSKHAHPKSAQVKPAPGKQVVSKKEQKQEHASKAPAANKRKQQKTQDPKSAS